MKNFLFLSIAFYLLFPLSAYCQASENKNPSKVDSTFNMGRSAIDKGILKNKRITSDRRKSSSSLSNSCIGDEGCIPDAKWSVSKRSGARAIDDPLFCQGEEVTVCVDFIYNQDSVSNDWLQGMIPDFGPGWDLAASKLSSPIGMPFSPVWIDNTDSTCTPRTSVLLPNVCISTDPLSGVTSLCHKRCQSCACSDSLAASSILPSGWYWNTPKDSISPISCNPNNNYGIGSTKSNVKLCVDLKVRTFTDESDCETNRDLRFHFITTSDALTGSWKDNLVLCFEDYKQLGPKWEIGCNRAPKVLGNDFKLCHEGKINLDISNEEGLGNIVIDITPIDNPYVTGENAYIFQNGSGLISDYLVNIGNKIEEVMYIASSSSVEYPCSSIPDTFRVIIYPELKVEFDNPYPLCIESPWCVMLTPNVSGGTGQYTGTSIPYTPAFEWSTGQTSKSICVHPLAESIYRVSVTDDVGCGSTGQAHVIPSSVTFNFDKEFIELCPEDDSAYVNILNIESLTDSTRTYWDIPVGLNANGNNSGIWIIPESSSTSFSPYTVVATVIDSSGCGHSQNFTVIVYDTTWFYLDSLIVTDKSSKIQNIIDQNYIPGSFWGFRLLSTLPEVNITSTDTIGNITFNITSDSSQIFEIVYELCDQCKCKQSIYLIDYRVPVNVEETLLKQISITHSNDEITIENPSHTVAMVSIIDALGRIVYTDGIQNNPISTKILNSGVYYVIIRSGINTVSKIISVVR